MSEPWPCTGWHYQQFLSLRNICGLCCWQELRILQYYNTGNFSQQKWRAPLANSLPWVLQNYGLISFYFWRVILPILVKWRIKIRDPLWLQEDKQFCMSTGCVIKAVSSTFRLKFINRVGQKVSLTCMAHLLLSTTKNLIISGFYYKWKNNGWVGMENELPNLNVIENNYNYLNHLPIFTCFQFSLWNSSWFSVTHHLLVNTRLHVIAVLFWVPESSSSKTHPGL